MSQIISRHVSVDLECLQKVFGVVGYWQHLKRFSYGDSFKFYVLQCSQASSAGGRLFNELCGLNVLYSRHHLSISTCTSFKVWKISCGGWESLFGYQIRYRTFLLYQ